MSFTCPQCGATSHHPEDEAQGYCGKCHDFTDLVVTFDGRRITYRQFLVERINGLGQSIGVLRGEQQRMQAELRKMDDRDRQTAKGPDHG